jgi:N-acetyl sugar amidotransferase
MDKHNRMCVRCVMDTTDPDIAFDENGYCNHCSSYFTRLKFRPTVEQGNAYINKLVAQMKEQGRGKDYDCVLGLSGGCDSSYLAFKVIELGLRPLTLHFDSGWNTELSVQNIEKIIKHLNIDLFTIVCDWEEMRDLQRSFFLASLVNCDIPQDHAFIAALNTVAAQHGIRYWISGHDYWGSESILASAWRGYDSRDWRHITGVHRAMGGKKLKNYPHYNFFELFFYYPLIKRIKAVNLFGYLPYNKMMAKEFLKKEIQWKDYTGKHNESIFTRFFQGYYLPKKFGYDKRKAHLSSLIVSNQISRVEALEELAHDFYIPEQLQEDMDFILKKLGFTSKEWSQIMATTPKTHLDFPSNHRLFSLQMGFRKLGSRIKRSLRQKTKPA